MISLINFILIFYILILFIGIVYSVKNVYYLKTWQVIRWALAFIAIIVLIMFCCLLTTKEKVFLLSSSYDLVPINHTFIQDYKDEYTIFIKDKNIHSINIPKEYTEIIYTDELENTARLNIEEKIKMQTLNLPVDIVEDKIIENDKKYFLKIPDKSYIKTVKL
jgi:hypothetical protein